LKGTVKKDGSTWTYFVYIGNDENGKRIYKRKRGFKTKRECDSALIELLSQVEKGTLISNDKMTVKEYLDYWLDTYPKNQCQPSTYTRYSKFVKDIQSYLGSIKLVKLNALSIEKFYNDLINERSLSPNTAIKVHRMLHLSLKHAQQWGLLNNNPCDLVNVPKGIKVEMKYWSPDEITFYLDLLKDERLYVPIFLAIHTGLRLGELCAIKWSDIDMVNETLVVNKSLQRINSKLQVKQPKTKNSYRTVTLFSSTMELLKKLKKSHLERKLKYGIELDFVIDWEDGRPIDPHYISQHFPKILKAHNIPVIRFHDLRHSHATLLLKTGTNAKVISKRLGHSTVSFTLDIYSHVDTDMQREEVSKASKFL
jgi:integrase